jgi:hypothetical protein
MRASAWSFTPKTKVASSRQRSCCDGSCIRRWSRLEFLASGRPRRKGPYIAFATRREARARARCADHVALAPPRPLIAEGDDRHLRTLGARRAKASGSQDGGRLPGLTPRYSIRTRARRKQPPQKTFCLALQELRDGPGRSRTCDLGIKSPLLYQLSYRPAKASVDRLHRREPRAHRHPRTTPNAPGR